MSKHAWAQHRIGGFLRAWAEANGQRFPNEPKEANANFRMLFKSRLIDDERGFAFPGDGWCLKGKPDGHIGSGPDFAGALEPGELSVAYVAGLTLSSSGSLPIMISGAGPATGWIVGVDQTPPRDLFTGPIAITFVDGTTKIMTPKPDGKIRSLKDGKEVDIFSDEWGTKMENIRLPAPVKK